jgi:hypothetical protein
MKWLVTYVATVMAYYTVGPLGAACVWISCLGAFYFTNGQMED